MSGQSLKHQLRLLIAEHGLRCVNEAVHEVLREDYEYLRGLFGEVQQQQNLKKTEAVSASEPVETSAPTSGEVVAASAPAVNPAPSDSTMKKVRVRVMKAKTDEVPATVPQPLPVADAAPAPAPAPLNILVPSPSTAASSTVSSPLSQPQAQRSAQDIKKFQKLAEETKRRELKEKGITVEQILTKENLQKWIVEEKHTFAWVAREKAGCPETQVSSIAKSMGIQSPISIRRGLLVSKRKV